MPTPKEALEERIAQNDTYAQLYRSLKYTRMEKGGIPLVAVREIIEAVFDKAEISALVDLLRPKQPPF